MAKITKTICDMDKCESTYDVQTIEIAFGVETMFKGDMCRDCREILRKMASDLKLRKR